MAPRRAPLHSSDRGRRARCSS